MAQSGYTPILIYGSATPGNTPSAGNLTSTTSGAELALNYADGKLFYKDSGGTVQVLATKGTGAIGGSNTQVQFNNNGVLGGASGFTWDGTYLTVNSLKNSALTSGRVTFAGASGLLSDSSNLTWNGTTLAITGALTATADSTFSSTGALTISKGTTAQRPGSAVSGMFRFNTTSAAFEGYNGSAWTSVGGITLSDDTSTASNLYPLFAAATSGAVTTEYVSSTKLLYRPSDGQLTAPEMYASNGVLTHANQVTSNYTVPTNANVITVGPWTVASGASFTLPSGSRQVLL